MTTWGQSTFPKSGKEEYARELHRCADIFRNIRNTRNKTATKIKYEHADGHIDKYLLFTQMTLEQQMNYWCDKKANKAVERSAQHKFVTEGKQLLPAEDAAVFVGG